MARVTFSLRNWRLSLSCQDSWASAAGEAAATASAAAAMIVFFMGVSSSGEF
ncbi:MAG: hypothetical protein M5U09_05615 [Gammaproteobacteria bacterium]|nr:hypothetical protein [Gammaproteobacteria bacterium]